jgi:hypothetical protein
MYDRMWRLRYGSVHARAGTRSMDSTVSLPSIVVSCIVVALTDYSCDYNRFHQFEFTRIISIAVFGFIYSRYLTQIGLLLIDAYIRFILLLMKGVS